MGIWKQKKIISKTRADVSITRMKWPSTRRGMPQFGDGRGEYFPHPHKAFNLKFLRRDQILQKHRGFGHAFVPVLWLFWVVFFWERSTATLRWYKMKYFFCFVVPFHCSETRILSVKEHNCCTTVPRSATAAVTLFMLLVNSLFSSIYDISESST